MAKSSDGLKSDLTKTPVCYRSCQRQQLMTLKKQVSYCAYFLALQYKKDRDKLESCQRPFGWAENWSRVWELDWTTSSSPLQPGLFYASVSLSGISLNRNYLEYNQNNIK